jgi:hypothetical protein
MHMVHDFTRLAGDSPGEIFRGLDMFVLPEVLSNRPGNPFVDDVAGEAAAPAAQRVGC